jgi:hypothetical protein
MKNIDKLKENLDAAKKQHETVSASIENLERELAIELCPYKIGDRIKYRRDYKSGPKDFEGIIDHIFAQYNNPAECFIPQVGKYPTWAVSGKKINVGGEIGKHGFVIGPAYYKFDQSTGIYSHKDLDEYLSNL